MAVVVSLRRPPQRPHYRASNHRRGYGTPVLASVSSVQRCSANPDPVVCFSPGDVNFTPLCSIGSEPAGLQSEGTVRSVQGR